MVELAGKVYVSGLSLGESIRRLCR